MDLNEIFCNLNSDQIKELKDIINNNPESVVEFLQAKLNEVNKFVNELSEKKQILQSDEEYKELVQTPDLLEKNSVQMVNAEKYLSDFGEVKEELKSLFELSTSDNSGKDLATKLHDRMNAIMVEFLILNGYVNSFYYTIDEEDLDIQDSLLSRIDELADQYRMISYLYGEILGLDDNQIINKDSILGAYNHGSFFNDILEKGGSIKDIISSFYFNNTNNSIFLCVRDENNFLVYPRLSFPSTINDSSIEKEFKNMDSTIQKYSPFIGERVEQLYNEILKPYYEKNNIDIYSDNVFGTLSVIDDYRSKDQTFNYVAFSSDYELDLTQQIINEYISQKERKNGNSL